MLSDGDGLYLRKQTRNGASFRAGISTVDAATAFGLNYRDILGG